MISCFLPKTSISLREGKNQEKPPQIIQVLSPAVPHFTESLRLEKILT